MIGFIYKIECIPTGECYIGQTIDINRRKNKHYSTLNNNKHDNPKLQNAWNKYGENNFSFTFWSFDNITEEQLNELECKYIEKYNSLNNGFNLVPGGGFLPSKQKIKDEDVVIALCFLEKFESGYGKAIEEYFGWSEGTSSRINTKNCYPRARDKFNSLSEIEKEQLIVSHKEQINKIKLKRRLNSHCCEKAYTLTKDDYNFSFAAQELGHTYTQVAFFLGVKPTTVKDWFNHRSRKKEYNSYQQLPEEEKKTLFKKVKEENLDIYESKKCLKYNEEDILNYLCYKEFYNGNDSLIQKLYNWAEGSCYNIRKPNRYKSIKAKFTNLTKDEILNRANLVNLAVLKSRN